RFSAAWLLILALVSAGVAAFSQDYDDDFTLPGSKAQNALDSLQSTFPEAAGVSAWVIAVAEGGDSVEDAKYEDAIEDEVDLLEDQPHVDQVTSPYSTMVNGAISDDETAAMISVQYDGTQQDVGEDAGDELLYALEPLQDDLPGAQVEGGGELF